MKYFNDYIFKKIPIKKYLHVLHEDIMKSSSRCKLVRRPVNTLDSIGVVSYVIAKKTMIAHSTSYGKLTRQSV